MEERCWLPQWTPYLFQLLHLGEHSEKSNSKEWSELGLTEVSTQNNSQSTLTEVTRGRTWVPGMAACGTANTRGRGGAWATDDLLLIGLFPTIFYWLCLLEKPVPCARCSTKRHMHPMWTLSRPLLPYLTMCPVCPNSSDSQTTFLALFCTSPLRSTRISGRILVIAGDRRLAPCLVQSTSAGRRESLGQKGSEGQMDVTLWRGSPSGCCQRRWGCPGEVPWWCCPVSPGYGLSDVPDLQGSWDTGEKHS